MTAQPPRQSFPLGYAPGLVSRTPKRDVDLPLPIPTLSSAGLDLPPTRLPEQSLLTLAPA